MYEASEVIEGIVSRKGAFPARLLPSLLSLASLGDLLGDCLIWLLLAFGVSALDGELPESYDLALSWLIGGWLWNRQKTWYSDARSLAAMTLHSGPCSPS